MQRSQKTISGWVFAVFFVAQSRRLMINRRRLILTHLLLCYLFFSSFSATAGELPKGFVYLKSVVPDIVLDMRYCTNDNFIGRPIDGYMSCRCIITEAAAKALKEVQDELKRFSLGLKVFDTYRPQRAVDNFVRWAKDLQDTNMKSKHYPDVAKKDLFKKGYIFGKSGHSRGSTVDLTIIYLDARNRPHELDMGTGFDFFSPKSWPEDSTMTPQQRGNRMLLQLVMEKHGFIPYAKEWWHFTLKGEPYPDTYFDFPVNHVTQSQ